MHHQSGGRGLVLLAASVLLGACAGVPGLGAPSSYRLDTVTNTCRQSPSNCAAMAGDRPALSPIRTLATAGATIGATLLALDSALQARIDKALEECADDARSEVLLRRMGGRSPTPADCREQVGVDEWGAAVTRAMQLGEEMHRVALQCAQRKLGELRPGGFSLEQRYRYDKETGRTTLVSREEKEDLLRRGLRRELLGTLEPDVVIHSGNPLRAEVVYDFKFPCVNSDRAPDWRRFPEGHPYAGSSQGKMYGDALRTQEVWRVVPRLGVIR